MEKARKSKTGAFSRTIGTVSYLLVLIPAALALIYVRAFGVSVVFIDAWTMVPLFNRWSSGKFRVSDLFAQHNEHRMFFPKGVELLLGVLTKYDNVVEMYLVLICLLVTLVVLLLAFRSSSTFQPFERYSVLLFVPIAFLVFSFRQHENMLFGFQINFAFVEAFGVLALFLLHTVGRRSFNRSAFAAAIGSATVASFSVVQGLFVWPVGLLQLFFSPVRKPTKRIFIVLWGVVGLGEWIVYFFDYATPTDAPPLFYAFSHPLTGADYFLSLLGSSLFWQHTPAFVGGLLLACFALVSLLPIYKGRRLGGYSFWVFLLLYSLLIVASITLGRAGYGVGQALIGQALASRYTSFSILAVVSIYAMLVITAFERRSRTNTALLAALSGIVALGVAISYPEGIEAGNQQRVFKEKAAFVLSTYESQPDKALESLHPLARSVRREAPILQGLGYNVFSDPQARDLPPLSALSPVAARTDSSHIDALSTDVPTGAGGQEGSVTVPKEASFVQVSGWAMDSENDGVAGGVYVDVDDTLFPAFYGTNRQDVADSFGDSSYRYSGFERAIPTSEIGAGAHELSIVVLTNDKEGYYRPDQKVVFEVR